jgi:YidC/Oxa1 family membrane protein insertase
LENDNERRTIAAIGLSLLVYMVWMSMFSPPLVPPDVGVDTVADLVETPAPMGTDTPASGPIVPQAGAAPAAGEAVKPTPVKPTAAPVPDRRVDIASTAWSGILGSKEGAIAEIVLSGVNAQPEVTPIWSHLIDKATGTAGDWQAYSGGDQPQGVLGSNGRLVLAGAGDFGPDVGYRITTSEDSIVATGQVPSGLRITKTYVRTDNPNTLDVTVRFENQSNQPISRLWVGVADEMSGDAGRFTNAPRPFALVDDDIERLDDLEDADTKGPVYFDAGLGWFGVGDKYFMGILIPEAAQSGRMAFAAVGDGRYGAFWVDGTTLDSGASREHRYTAFIGPKNLDLLVPLGHQLDRSVEFGWFGFFAKALLWLLKAFHSVAGNWGLAIIMLTVLVKIVFFPLMQKQFVSSKRMQALQPQLKAMKEQYKDNRELQTQMTMKLFKEHEVNPMGGCLPMLIQMPVWFALYNVMLFSVELYNTSFLYLDDLTQVDPYGVLPLLVSGLMLLQQRMMPMANMDPMQQKMMRMMPLMFGIFMFSFPGGLVLYFSINNTLTILQQWIIYRNKDEAPVTAAS